MAIPSLNRPSGVDCHQVRKKKVWECGEKNSSTRRRTFFWDIFLNVVFERFKPYREVILFLFSIPSPGGQSGFTSEPAKTIGAGTPPDFCCEKVCVRRSYRALRDKSRPFDRLDALMPHIPKQVRRERESHPEKTERMMRRGQLLVRFAR